MIVDIGSGTTNVAVLSLNGVAASSSIKVAGDSFDEAIDRYVRRNHGVVIGKTMAEDIKIRIGRVWDNYGGQEELRDSASMVVTGRDAKTGVVRPVELTSADLDEVLWRPARQIVEEVLSVLENTSPELVSDIAKNGITMTGGGSSLSGIDRMIEKRTGIRCIRADDADSCVAYGCGKSLGWISKMKEGPINVARKRAMRGL